MVTYVAILSVENREHYVIKGILANLISFPLCCELESMKHCSGAWGWIYCWFSHSCAKTVNST